MPPLHDVVVEKAHRGVDAVIEGIDRVLSKGIVDINLQDSVSKETVLHVACALESYQNTEGIVRYLLNIEGIDLNSLDRHGLTPLHHATGLRRYPGVVKALLEAGANPNTRQHDTGYTALHYACGGLDFYNSNGDTMVHRTEIVQHLLKAGADPTILDNSGSVPLHYTRSAQVGELLLRQVSTQKRKVEFLNTGNRMGDTPLHCSVYRYEEEENNDHCMYVPEEDDEDELMDRLDASEMAKLLVLEGADVMIPNKRGIKPIDCLAMALKKDVEDGGIGYISMGLNEIIGFLTSVAPAMLNQVNDKNGGSSIDTLQGRADVASVGGKMLLRVMQEYNGDNGEDLVAEHIDPLIAMGADVNYTDPDTGCNMVHHFLNNLHLDDNLGDDLPDGMQGWIIHILNRLVPHHVPPDLLGATTKDGRNVLHIASKRGYAKVAARLLGLAQPQLQCQQEHVQQPLLLLNVDQYDDMGWTPLHVASNCTDGEEPAAHLVEVLVQNGSLVTNRTKEEVGGPRTALDIATQTRNTSVLEFLRTSPIVYNQLEAHCKKAIKKGSSPGLIGLLLERLFYAGPAGVTTIYKFLPYLLESNTNQKKRPLSDIAKSSCTGAPGKCIQLGQGL